MAIATDSTSFIASAGNTNTGGSWNHTIVGSNALLLVGFNYGANSTAVTSVSYNGSAMTRINSVNWPGGVVGTADLWYIANPTVGTHSITVAFGSTVSWNAVASAYTGAILTGIPDSSNTFSATTSAPSMSTTVVASNCWTVGVLNSQGGTAFTPNAGTTVRVDRMVADTTVFLDSNGTVSTGSQSLSGSQGSSLQYRGVIASIAPAAVAVNSNFFFFM